MDRQKAIDWSIIFDRQWNKDGRDRKDGYAYRMICNAMGEGHNGALIPELSESTTAFLKKQGFQIEEENDGPHKCWIVSWQQEVII